MLGETDLDKLLETMSPDLAPGEFVFCSLDHARYGDRAELTPVAAVYEDEGLTLVVPRAQADAHGLAYAAVFRRITLKVHSSLEAVGLTAAFAGALAAQGISANVIAGFYHDHIYVPESRAAEAMGALNALTRGA